MKIEWGKLVAGLVLCFSAAAIGGYFTGPAITGWYALLQKPFFSPPNWVFGPVWTALYALMAISLYYYWTSKKPQSLGFAAFGAQLALNAGWSIVFFGLQAPLLALLVIVFLEAAIIACMALFWRTSRTAAWLLLPYALWVAFATLLNYSIASLN